MTPDRVCVLTPYVLTVCVVTVCVVQLATELVAPRRLEEHVSNILLRLEKELDQAEATIGEWHSTGHIVSHPENPDQGVLVCSGVLRGVAGLVT